MFDRPLFHIQGIPVSADPWSLLGFLVIFDLAGGGSRGLYAAVALVFFTIIHECGHAFTAVHYGAQNVSIRLAFLGGWASYSDERGLSRRQRNIISLAGPATQFAVATVLLLVIRIVVPQTSTVYFSLWGAIAFAGVVLAALNLLPLVPLDGSSVLLSYIHPRWGSRGRTIFLWWTLGASVVMVICWIGQKSYAKSLPVPGYNMISDSYVDVFPLAILKMVAAAPFIVTTSLFIAVFCGSSAWTRLRGEGSILVSRPAQGGMPKIVIPRSGRESGPSRRPVGRTAPAPRSASPGRAKKSRRKDQAPAEVVPIRPEPRLDRADQADMDSLLDKISATGIDSLTPDERRRLDDHSRRLRGQ